MIETHKFHVTHFGCLHSNHSKRACLHGKRQKLQASWNLHFHHIIRKNCKMTGKQEWGRRLQKHCLLPLWNQSFSENKWTGTEKHGSNWFQKVPDFNPLICQIRHKSAENWSRSVFDLFGRYNSKALSFLLSLISSLKRLQSIEKKKKKERGDVRRGNRGGRELKGERKKKKKREKENSWDDWVDDKIYF